MTDPAPSPEAIPDVTAALPALLPEIRRETAQGWMLIAAVVIVAGLVLAALAGVDDEPLPWMAVIVVFAGLGVAEIARRVRRAHEATIMPILAETAGLQYSQNARPFLDALPTRLLPKAGVRKAEDLVSGNLGDRPIRFAEVHFETGGKNSSTLFKGVVAEFPNAAPMPPFFLASEQETRGWWVFDGNIKVDDLVRIRSLTGGAAGAYGVWASTSAVADHPGLDAVLKILTQLQNAIGSGAALYTASSNGQVIHVALGHKRDLFRIGGLFAAQAQLITDIKLAYRDLTMPLVIAAKLLEAEKGAIQQ